MYGIANIGATPLYIEQMNLLSIDSSKITLTEKKIKEHKNVKRITSSFIPDFHKQNKLVSSDRMEFCTQCHSDIPHKENKLIRSFLNMHSARINCATCHFEANKKKIDYLWVNFNASTNKNKILKISPSYMGEPIMIFSDHELAQQIKADWDKKSVAEKARLKLRIHAPLTKKPVNCQSCHNSKRQILPLKSLGYNELQVLKINQQPIAKLFSRLSKQNKTFRLSEFLP